MEGNHIPQFITLVQVDYTQDWRVCVLVAIYFLKKMYQQLRVWGTSGLFVLCQKNSTTIPKNIYITQGTYYLRPQKTNVLAFKICLTKSVCLACSKIYLIKAIPSTKKKYIQKSAQSQSHTQYILFYFSNCDACIY